MKFTAIIENGESGWFVRQIEEVPAAISQGRTIDELRENLTDALKLILDSSISNDDHPTNKLKYL